MDVNYNFYDILEITNTASNKKIIKSYQKKINKFNNINVLSKSQIQEIKILKMSLYILTNPILKNKYDVQFNKIYNHDVVAGNQNEDCNLDSLFNIDNEWMKTTEHTIETKSDLRKNKMEINMLGDRIFSLAQNNKRPGYSADFEIELRNQQQGRVEKTDKL